MTRFLSEALEAREPLFRRSLMQLERANGNPGTDIRLSSEVNLRLKAKLRELNMDPNDTTAEELYSHLQERLRQDDAILRRRLQTVAATHVSAAADPMQGLCESLKMLPYPKHAFGLKNSKLKSLLKGTPPKKTMKRLGYRSSESMLKREQPVLILAAAWLSESRQWRQKFLGQYKKLKPSDFENRMIQVLCPSTPGWKKLSQDVVGSTGHNVLCFKELATLILLPLPEEAPAGAVTASTCIALHEMNEIRAGSTYLKVCQVRQDFGECVLSVTVKEPELSSILLDRPVPWNLVQHYYSRIKGRMQHEVFEPYLQLEDMVWHPLEKALASIEPKMGFWQGTSHLGLVHRRKPVSMNIADCAINLCNGLTFDNRMAHYFKRSLWHEMLLRYMNHQPVELSVISSLQPQLAEESVLA